MDLKFLFEPKNIAVIGASTRPGAVGNDIVKNLVEQGFMGAIYPINPKADELYGLTCYADIADVPESEVDLAVMVIHAVAVPDALTAAAKTKHVKATVVISAGFREIGNVDLEDQLKAVAEQYDIALAGPNCLGIINPLRQMNASFAAKMPPAGSVAFLSQSGALCTAVLDYADELGLGFSRFVSLGNKAVADEAAFLEYLEKDEATKVIAMYIEDLKSPTRLAAVAQRVVRGERAKPIIVLKAGRTGAGAGASASHTGALAGDSAAYDAFFRQNGIIQAESIEELFSFTQVFAENPRSAGRRTAIVTNAGGPGVLATDAVVGDGLELAKFTPETEAALKSALPAAANTHNPVDVIGDAKADRYQAALEAVASDPQVDMALVLLTPQSMTEVEATADAIITAKQSYKKPIVASFMGADVVRPGVRRLIKGGVSTLRFPEEGARALAALADFSERSQQEDSQIFSFNDIDQAKARQLIVAARTAGVKQLVEVQAVPVFAAYGFRTLKSVVARTSEEMQQYARASAAPFVMKIISPDILHKSDVGGVAVGVKPENAAAEYEAMLARVTEKKPEAHIEGVLCVEMAPLSRGAELVLGSVKDPVFGHMVMVGLGGILVEVLKDVSFGLVPFNQRMAREMIDQLKGRKILSGVRGGAALDVNALVDALGRLSQLLVDFPEIKELDVNPLLVLPEGEGTMVLDGRIVLE